MAGSAASCNGPSTRDGLGGPMRANPLAGPALRYLAFLPRVCTRCLLRADFLPAVTTLALILFSSWRPFFLPRLCKHRVMTRRFGENFSLRVCSFNVLSLNSLSLEGSAADGLAYQPARPALLADSLRAAGVHVALLQETRTEEGFLRTQDTSASLPGPPPAR